MKNSTNAKPVQNLNPETCKPPRVAVVMHLFPTVSETFILNQVTGLMDLGYEVDVYAWAPENLDHHSHRQINDYLLIQKTTYLPEVLDHEVVARQFQSREYCAVHCHFGFVSEKLAFLKRHLENVPFLVTFHGKDIRAALDEGWQIFQSTFENFDRFISICGYNRHRLEQLGCPPEKIVDLPNGVDTSWFSPGRGRHQGAVRMTTVARLHPVKNIPFAVRVMHRLAQSGLDFHYDVLGHGPDRPEIELLIEQLGLTSRITLHGQCSQHVVARKLAESDLFFLPSRNEASPVCILEAQSAALPVVATGVGGIPELVIDGENGYVVDSEDEEAAAKWLLSLAKDPAKRSVMGANGRMRARKHHDLRMLIRQCASMYGAVPRPTVSVIIPTYNRDQMLSTAIESVLDQDYQDFELIIVDDGSTDQTRSVVESYIQRFPGVIRYQHQPKKNAASARNAGICMARGKYLAFLHSDDYWRPEKLARQVACLDRNPGVGLVHTGVEFVRPRKDPG